MEPHIVRIAPGWAERVGKQWGEVFVGAHAVCLQGTALLIQIIEALGKLMHRHVMAKRNVREKLTTLIHRTSKPRQPMRAQVTGAFGGQRRPTLFPQRPLGLLGKRLLRHGLRFVQRIGCGLWRRCARFDTKVVELDPGQPQGALVGEEQCRREGKGEVPVIQALVDREQGVALVEDPEPVRGELPGGRVLAMVGRGAGGVEHLVAEQVQPPAEVGVLEEAEVERIEPAGKLEKLPRDQHRAATGRDHTALAIERRGTGAVIQLETVPFEIQGPADEVDRRPVPVHDPAAKASDRGVVGHRRDEVAQPALLEPHVVVDKRDPRMAGGLRCPVVALGESIVLFEGDHADAGILRANIIGRPVARAVVTENDLQLIAGVFERQRRLQAAVEVGTAVVIEDDQ